jgi:hypothetical protein
VKTWRFWSFVVLATYLFFRLGSMAVGVAPFSWTVVYPALVTMYFGAWVWFYYRASPARR